VGYHRWGLLHRRGLGCGLGDNMKRLFLVVFLVLWAGVGWCATRYIDPDCVNNGDGTTTDCAAGAGSVGAYNTHPASLNAFDWLQKRGTTDTVVAMTFTQNGSTLGAYGTGADPIIDGTGETWVVYASGKTGIVVEDTKLVGGDSWTVFMNNSAATLTDVDIEADGIGVRLRDGTYTLTRVDVSGSTAGGNIHAEENTGSTVATIIDCDLHDSNPAVPADTEIHGLRVDDASVVTLIGGSIYNNKGDGANVNNTAVLTLNGVNIYDNGSVHVNSGDGATSHDGSTLNVQFCIITGNFKSGIAVTGTSSGEILNNTIYNNYEATNGSGWDSTGDFGIGVNSTGDWSIYNNITYDHPAEILITTTAVTGSVTLLMSNNDFYNPAGGAKYFYNNSTGLSYADWVTATATACSGGQCNTNGFNVDPQLNSNYLPGLTSLFSAGTFITGFHDTADGQSDYDGTFVAPYMIPIGAQGYERPSVGKILNGTWGN
jgi:hypothetical protein